MSRVKKALLVLIILSNCLSVIQVKGQTDDIYNQFVKFSDFYKSGDFISAEKCMETVLESEKKLSPDYLIPLYNSLGLIKKSLGLYTEALDYYNKAAEYALIDKMNLKELAFIYNNKSMIYTFRRSFPTAIEYIEKAIRIFQTLEKSDKSILPSLSTAYLNIGIIYYELKDYSSALENLEKSADLKLMYRLPEIELTYLNLAKTYSRMGDIKKTEEYFNKCFAIYEAKSGNNYYRLAEVYFDYGLFLDSERKHNEELEAYKKALSICLQNYGEKHTMVALACKHMGDYYLDQTDYKAALEYYQRSLISVVRDFNSTDVFSNPSVDSSFLDIQLLDILKSKAHALDLYGNEQEDGETKNKYDQ